MKKHMTQITVEGKEIRTREYLIWLGIKTRVLQNKAPAYMDCTISDNFMNFQYFAEWCQHQVGWSEHKWQLDKDLLVDGNREYHEDRCLFVPREINIALTAEKKPRSNGLPLGVVHTKEWNQYQARCNVYGVQEYLGAYRTPEEAHQAYVKRKNDYVQELAETYKGRVRDEVYVKLRDFVAR